MKKIFLYSLILGLSALCMTSCKDDADMTDSRLTYYVNLEMQGDAFVQVPIGTPYVDAGCTATMNGQDVTSRIVTTGLEDIDVNTAGLYTVTYSAINDDGFSASVERTVAVCDPTVTTDLSGTYAVQAGSYRFWFSSGATVPFSGQTITIKKAAPGIFSVSDLMGGYYDQRAGYGKSYAMSGYVQLTSDNAINVLSGYVPGWGDSYDSFSGGYYNPETGEIGYDLEYAGSMLFHIILNK